MDYTKHYQALVTTRKERILSGDVYFEKHHILPKSMGGTDHPNNLVNLTAREHFLAHWLLWRIHRNRKTAWAFKGMCNWALNTTSSRIYSEAKEAVNQFGHSKETREKISCVTKNMSQETKSLIAEAASRFWKNRKKSEQHRKSLSNSKIGKHFLTQSHYDKLKKLFENVPKSAETIEKMKISQRKRRNREGFKKIKGIQITVKNRLTSEETLFLSMRDVRRELGIGDYAIHKNLHPTYEFTKHFISQSNTLNK